jgi:hypothetical protein
MSQFSDVQSAEAVGSGPGAGESFPQELVDLQTRAVVDALERAALLGM